MTLKPLITVANVLFDDRMGGPQKRVIDVGAKLAIEGIETILVLPEGQGPAAAAARAVGLRVSRISGVLLPSWRRLGTVFWWWLSFIPVTVRFLRLFREERVDLVHVNGGVFLQPALAARIAGVDLVWHLNDTLLPRPLARISGLVVRGLAHRVVLAAEAVGKHYGVPPAEATVIYAPVDPDAFKATLRQGRSQGAHSVFRVGMLANWNPLKGQDVFLRMIQEIRSRFQSGICGVMGGRRLDSQPSYVRSVASLLSGLGLERVVQDVGFVEDVPGFMDPLHVFVLPSRSEACPMVVLEAMAAGIPVVATDVGGVKELVTDGPESSAGLLVTAGDPTGLADAVEEILRDPGLANEFAKAGPRRVAARFSIRACVQAHETVYHSVGR